LISDIKGGTYTEGISERDAEENIWTEEKLMTGGWLKLRNEELHNLYSSPRIIRMIKLRTMRWTWHVVRMRKKRNAYRIFVGKLEG
jgi:hypothetical protein